ncbi:MAG TPA: formimidoylglutamate deiminase, partial [Jatrophihabitantaceae bacterium]|nr:formimidoylglutamate deiminase [Jatrophihabitantaceae bacterium]
MTIAYRAAHAWLPDGVAHNVRIDIDGTRIVSVQPDGPATPEERRLEGITFAGFANTHSHAFHRALRGRSHDGGGTFWTWRARMFEVAARLDPDSYLALARAVYAEMALAGVATVGEFHYLHHPPDGGRYDDPNAMGNALVQAAAEAGVRITVLDACYLAGGLGADGPEPLTGVQRRFNDGDATAWANRMAALQPGDHARIGAAIHSVRAVPRDQLPTVVAASAHRPLHMHLSEQPAENDQCLAAYGVTPTELLSSAGALGTNSTVVHATHVGAADIAILGTSGTS